MCRLQDKKNTMDLMKKMRKRPAQNRADNTEIRQRRAQCEARLETSRAKHDQLAAEAAQLQAEEQDADPDADPEPEPSPFVHTFAEPVRLPSAVFLRLQARASMLCQLTCHLSLQLCEVLA
jgi:hypothetical protein